jgi:signal transduction histidine kinase
VVKQRLSSDAIKAAMDDAAAVADLADIREATDLIDANIRRAHKLIRDFKQLSVGHIVDALETLSLVEVIDEVVGLFAISARQAKLTIDVRNSLPDAASSEWVGYRGFLSQIVLNLLTNVERYAYDRGTGGPVEIAIGELLEGRGAHFRVTVRDSGRGMPAETRARIFEPFYTTGRAKGASGLGMAIVYNLVTSALGGTIDVASREGAGTAVTLVFPKRVPAMAD